MLYSRQWYSKTRKYCVHVFKCKSKFRDIGANKFKGKYFITKTLDASHCLFVIRFYTLSIFIHYQFILLLAFSIPYTFTCIRSDMYVLSLQSCEVNKQIHLLTILCRMIFLNTPSLNSLKIPRFEMPLLAC